MTHPLLWKELRAVRWAFVTAVLWGALFFWIRWRAQQFARNPLEGSAWVLMPYLLLRYTSPVVAAILSLAPLGGDWRRWEFLRTQSVSLRAVLWLKWLLGWLLMLAVLLPQAALSSRWFLIAPLTLFQTLLFAGMVLWGISGAAAVFVGASILVQAQPGPPVWISLPLPPVVCVILALGTVACLPSLAWAYGRTHIQPAGSGLQMATQFRSPARSCGRAWLRHVWTETKGVFFMALMIPPAFLAAMVLQARLFRSAGAAVFSAGVFVDLALMGLAAVGAVLVGVGHHLERECDATAFLRTLPISRSAALRLRLVAAVTMIVVITLALLAYLAIFCVVSPSRSEDHAAARVLQSGLLALALTAAAFSLTPRLPLVISVLTIMLVAPLIAAWSASSSLWNPWLTPILVLAFASPWLAPWLDWEREV